MRNLLVAISIAACGSSPPPPAPPVANEVANEAPPPAPPTPPADDLAAVTVRIKEFETAMCACKDSACAQKVSGDMTAWGQEQAKASKNPPKMTEEQTKTLVAIGEHMGKCMQAAMGASTP